MQHTDSGLVPLASTAHLSTYLCRNHKLEDTNDSRTPKIPYNLHSLLSTVCSAMKRQGRQLSTLICIIIVVLCLSMYSNSVVWKSIGVNKFTVDDNSLTMGGSRKLLEEGEGTAEKFHPPPGMKRRLPHCIIFGVRKCGTRAMLEFLGLHEQIRPADHEVHYFDDDTNYKQGLEWYKNQMPYSYSEQVTVEKSPRYFITEKVPQRIHNMNSSIKLIVLLRNPTIRVISDYTQVYYNKLAKGKPLEKLENLVINPVTGDINRRFKAIKISIYYQHFERWLKVFRRDQIHVVDGDNLIVEPWVELSKVEQFLGLKHSISKDNFYFNSTRGFYCMRTGPGEKCLGATKGRKHPYTDPGVVNQLRKFFRPYNHVLYKMINRTFDWD